MEIQGCRFCRYGRGSRNEGVWRPMVGVVLLTALIGLTVPEAWAIGPYAVGKAAVLDQGTGLVWQKSDDGTLRDWQGALAYCENLELESKADWRLPSIRELKSIVENSRYYPVIDPVFSARSANYWSSTSVAGHPVGHAWVVNFANGDDNWYLKATQYNARCVRGGVAAP